MNESERHTPPTLLLIEDEKDTAALATLIMKAEGYHVVHAADGLEAVSLLSLMPPPALIVLDLHLPHVDGVTVLDRIRSTPGWADLPVVVLTGASDESSVREVFALRVKDYLLKPFKRDALAAYLREARNGLPPMTAA